jgi:SpoVK/Ycf46/Vps4 family AAA+-type ATPase
VASQQLHVSKEDFEHGLLLVHPSVMNEAYIEVPKVRWSDIAGSENVKAKLWEAVDLPLKVRTCCPYHYIRGVSDPS